MPHSKASLRRLRFKPLLVVMQACLYKYKTIFIETKTDFAVLMLIIRVGFHWGIHLTVTLCSKFMLFSFP